MRAWLVATSDPRNGELRGTLHPSSTVSGSQPGSFSSSGPECMAALTSVQGPLRCELLRLLPHLQWPQGRRGLLMIALHELQSADPEVRLAALDALHSIHSRMPRFRGAVEQVLQAATRIPCRSTSMHAARLLDCIATPLSSE